MVMLTVTSKSYTPPDNMTVSPGAATWRATVTEEYEQPSGHTDNTADHQHQKVSAKKVTAGEAWNTSLSPSKEA